MTTYTFDVQPIANTDDSQFVYSTSGDAGPKQIKSNYTYIDESGNVKVTQDTFNKTNFKNTQRKRCILDMRKDSLIKDENEEPVKDDIFKTHIANMYGIRPNNQSKYKKDLTDLKKKINEAQDTKFVTKMTWTKINKIPNALSYKNVFIESGKNPDDFLHPNWKQIGNFASIILDPAGRPPLKESTDEVWPPKNSKFIFTTEFLSQFGFPENIMVEAKTNQSVSEQQSSATLNNAFDYSINIGNKTINNASQDGASPQDPGNPNYFCGNSKKNGKINTYPNNFIVNNSLLICKEMGDVFQVLLMWVWCIINGYEKDYTIFTCDHVVYLLCQILGLNCIIPSTEKDNDNNVEVRALNIYRPTLLTASEVKKKQFEIEYENIKKSNDLQILIVDSIINNNTKFTIKVPQFTDFFINTPYTLDAFKKIKKDMENINNKLNTSYGFEIAKINDSYPIEQKIKELKSFYRIFDIFKYNKNKSTITLNSVKTGYTNKNPLAQTDLSFTALYKQTSIYNLIVNNVKGLGGGTYGKGHRKAHSKRTIGKAKPKFPGEYLGPLEIKRIYKIKKKIESIKEKFPISTFTKINIDINPKLESYKEYEDYYTEYVDEIIKYSSSSYYDELTFFTKNEDSKLNKVNLTANLKSSISRSLPLNFAKKYPDIDILIWDNLMEEFYFDEEVCWNDNSNINPYYYLEHGKLHKKINKIVYTITKSVYEMNIVGRKMANGKPIPINVRIVPGGEPDTKFLEGAKVLFNHFKEDIPKLISSGKKTSISIFSKMLKKKTTRKVSFRKASSRKVSFRKESSRRAVASYSRKRREKKAYRKAASRKVSSLKAAGLKKIKSVPRRISQTRF